MGTLCVGSKFLGRKGTHDGIEHIRRVHVDDPKQQRIVASPAESAAISAIADGAIAEPGSPQSAQQSGLHDAVGPTLYRQRSSAVEQQHSAAVAVAATQPGGGLNG